MIHVIGRPPITGVECGRFTATFKLRPRAGGIYGSADRGGLF